MEAILLLKLWNIICLLYFSAKLEKSEVQKNNIPRLPLLHISIIDERIIGPIISVCSNTDIKLGKKWVRNNISENDSQFANILLKR